MQEVKIQLSSDSPIAQDVALLTSTAPILSPQAKDSLTVRLVREFDEYLQENLSNKDLSAVEFSFAVAKMNQGKIILSSKNHETSVSNFSRYSQVLSGTVTARCNCQLILQLNVQNMFGYLLGRLRNLIIPSLLFLLLLIACFFWLIHIVNKQRKLAEVKNDFINNLTHELKTPVFSVGLASKLLEEHLSGLPSEKPKEYLRLIRVENEKMKGHIDAVLELATLENGRYILDKVEVKIDFFLREIAEGFRSQIEKQNGLLETHFNCFDLSILIDKTHLNNTIQNLLENAIKYGRQQKLQITISTQKTSKYFFIKIKDNGKGIPKEDQGRIFEKFYRVNTGDVHDVKGFGLGLSYAKQVIERHGGSIHVDSSPDVGSTFTIKIPIK